LQSSRHARLRVSGAYTLKARNPRGRAPRHACPTRPTAHAMWATMRRCITP